MVNSLLYADATTNVEDAKAVLFGVPFDRTASFRSGSRLGPNAIREASWNFETYSPEHDRDVTDFPFADTGNTDEFGSSSEMVCPTLTNHLPISPSTTPSPMSGSLNL